MSTIQVHGPYLDTTSTTSKPTKLPGHHGRRYAVLAISGAAIVLAGLAGVQYLSTQTTVPSVTQASVAKFVVPHGALAVDAADAARASSVTVVQAATVPTVMVPHGALAVDAADAARASSVTVVQAATVPTVMVPHGALAVDAADAARASSVPVVVPHGALAVDEAR